MPTSAPTSKLVQFGVFELDLLSGELRRQGVHEHPRWKPDSSSLIYFTPDPSPREPGTLWELSALGGVPRKIASAVSGADVSHDGRRIATFQFRGADVALVTMSQDGTMLREIKRFPKVYGYAMPRLVAGRSLDCLCTGLGLRF